MVQIMVGRARKLKSGFSFDPFKMKTFNFTSLNDFSQNVRDSDGELQLLEFAMMGDTPVVFYSINWGSVDSKGMGNLISAFSTE